MRNITVQITNEYNETKLVSVLEDENGLIYHLDGNRILDGELVTLGRNREGDTILYDYGAESRHDVQRRNGHKIK